MGLTGSLKSHATSITHKPTAINLSQENKYSFHRSSPKPILWSMVLLFMMGFIASSFILWAFHNLVLLIVVVAFFGAVAAVFIWNTYWRRRVIIGFIARYPDAELETDRDGQFIEVSGVVTCGSVSSGVIWCPLLTADSITKSMSSYTIHTHQAHFPHNLPLPVLPFIPYPFVFRLPTHMEPYAHDHLHFFILHTHRTHPSNLPPSNPPSIHFHYFPLA